MKWYLSKLVFRVIYISGSHTAQFDEQLRLIYAEDEFHAFQKARTIGDRECMNTTMHNGIEWKFIDVSEIYPLVNMADGAEVFSVITEESDADLYIQNTQKRALQLLQNGLHIFTSINNTSLGH
jgi:Domain of unknown function (DUF4288)